ncbi:MAG: hypothetical protein M3209_16770 [Acidobacteriota bacterium]|nr:hypothetical protein [Acidobacteriota bacterium]
MSEPVKRLENLYRKFKRLSHKQRAEFFTILELTKQLAESPDVLALLNEFESILKSEAQKHG